MANSWRPGRNRSESQPFQVYDPPEGQIGTEKCAWTRLLPGIQARSSLTETSTALIELVPCDATRDTKTASTRVRGPRTIQVCRPNRSHRIFRRSARRG